MSLVNHMVCPACRQMNGREHEADCPWNGMDSPYMRPYPGESEAYAMAQAKRILAAQETDPAD